MRGKQPYSPDSGSRTGEDHQAHRLAYLSAHLFNLALGQRRGCEGGAGTAAARNGKDDARFLCAGGHSGQAEGAVEGGGTLEGGGEMRTLLIGPSGFSPNPQVIEIIGGPDRDRTDDLFHAMEARSQLRHRPT